MIARTVDQNMIDTIKKRDLPGLTNALKNGANPNFMRPYILETPLHEAVLGSYPNPEIVKILLQYGANPSQKRVQNGTPIDTPLECFQKKELYRYTSDLTMPPHILSIKRLLTVGWQQVEREEAAKQEVIKREAIRQAAEQEAKRQVELARQQAMIRQQQEATRLAAEATQREIERQQQEAIREVERKVALEKQQEAAKQALIEEAARQVAAEEAVKRAAIEETIRQEAIKEVAKQALIEEAARQVAAEEAVKQAAIEETIRQEAIKEAAKQAPIEEAARSSVTEGETKKTSANDIEKQATIKKNDKQEEDQINNRNPKASLNRHQKYMRRLQSSIDKRQKLRVSIRNARRAINRKHHARYVGRNDFSHGSRGISFNRIPTSSRSMNFNRHIFSGNHRTMTGHTTGMSYSEYSRWVHAQQCAREQGRSYQARPNSGGQFGFAKSNKQLQAEAIANMSNRKNMRFATGNIALSGFKFASGFRSPFNLSDSTFYRDKAMASFHYNPRDCQMVEYNQSIKDLRRGHEDYQQKEKPKNHREMNRNAGIKKPRRWNISARALGALQCVSGAAQVAVGVAGGRFVPVVGASLATLGIDNTVAGCTTLWTGEHQPTQLNRGLQGTGLSSHQADIAEASLNLGPLVAGPLTQQVGFFARSAQAAKQDMITYVGLRNGNPFISSPRQPRSASI
jgi:hypothetical protein